LSDGSQNQVEGCPGVINGNTMSIFWSGYQQGTVHLMIYDKDRIEEVSPNNITKLGDDINEAFSTAAIKSFFERDKRVDVTHRKINTVQQAYILTWENMKNSFGGKAVSKRSKLHPHIFYSLQIMITMHHDI